jgi:hypothetical protein
MRYGLGDITDPGAATPGSVSTGGALMFLVFAVGVIWLVRKTQ